MHKILHFLRINIPFAWDEQVQYTFYALKQALTSAPLLYPPEFTKDFILYVSTFENAIAGVLVQEDDACQEHVIYYVSHKNFGPSLCYSHEEKMALVVVFLVQKLRHYILMIRTQVVVDSNPMHYLLTHHLIEGHAAKWIVFLQGYDLESVPPKSTKDLALASLMEGFPSSFT